jgi:hypothetical protein
VAAVEAGEKKPVGDEHAGDLRAGGPQLVKFEVDEGVEGDGGAQRALFEWQRAHFRDLEVEVWIEPACLSDHRRREIDTADRGPVLAQIASRVSRPAAEITDRPAGRAAISSSSARSIGFPSNS